VSLAASFKFENPPHPASQFLTLNRKSSNGVLSRPEVSRRFGQPFRFTMNSPQTGT
jgi:hypothetical protein